MKPILDLSKNNDYRSWVKELKQRYLSARLKASIEANRTLLEYYWSLGRDIADKQYANTYGSGFYKTLSHDLRSEMPEEKGFSESNIRYMYRFYELYNQEIVNFPQGAEKLFVEVCSIPWDHQRRIIDKCKGDAKKALFFVHKVIENSWGRDMLLNFSVPIYMSVKRKPLPISVRYSLPYKVTSPSRPPKIRMYLIS